MKKIYAITFFSALLVLGNENNILANSNLSSLETNDLIVTETNNSTFEEIETESGISITYDLNFNEIIGYTVPGELSDALSEQELNMLILKEVGNVLLNQSEEFQRIQNIINGTYDQENYHEEDGVGTFEEIETESGISITYDLDFNKIIGYTVPGELSDALSEQELNMLILKEVGNVLLNQSEEFQRIQHIINEANSEKIQEQRIQYRYPITISIRPRASRNFPLRGVAVGEKVFYNRLLNKY